MRALRCEKVGSPSDLVLLDVPPPEAGSGEVVVDIAAASLNFPDVLLVQGRYQVPAPVPFTPGSEFSGVVSALGAGVTSLRVGERVMGAALTGAFAERIAVPATALTRVPAGLDQVHAAAASVTFRTAYHALVTIGELRSGDDVVVLGAAGGVGSACVDIALRLGARVTAVVSSEDRARWSLERGAHQAIVHTREDVQLRVKELTAGGADVVVDPVGGPLSEQVLRGVTWGGRYVVVGFADGEIPRIPLNLVLLKGVVLRGFELRTLAHHLPEQVEAGQAQLDRLVADGLRPPVDEVIGLADVPDAMGRMQSRRTLGKVVVDLTL